MPEPDFEQMFWPWAKLGQGSYPAEAHPVLCHLADVGACAAALWNQVIPPSSTRRWSEALQLTPDQAGRWITFWAGSHDIGKVSPGFQSRDAATKQRLKMLGLDVGSPNVPPHGTISYAILKDHLANATAWTPLPLGFSGEIAAVIGGHHGIVPLDVELRVARANSGVGGWKPLQQRLLFELTAFAGVRMLCAPAPPSNDRRAFFLFLAGLISVADWLGSNKAFFAAHGCDGWDESRWKNYQQHARTQADRALGELGWIGWRPEGAGSMSFGELFPAISSPRPLQTVVQDIADCRTAAGLMVVEAPMGEGKTEAALYVADRGTHTLGCRGCYIALPTMATSNGMFRRVTAFLSQRYPHLSTNIQLLHGQTFLNPLYQDLLKKGCLPAELYDEDSQRPGGVVAEAWFAQDKKQGLLAPFAVGTIDQALLAVLQVKFGFVRLFGLAGKTVILDEVHAYDAYMSVLLGRLLRWLGALGCPVVLLSATLPEAKRKELIAEYLGKSAADVDLPATAYPRVTTVDPATTTVAAEAIPPAADRPSKLIRLHRLPLDELATQLRTALSQGGCAVVICNTVGRAQEVYQRLAGVFGNEVVRLFHARFPLGDRAEIEQKVLQDFGPPPGSRPATAILVATQVVEQSLDLDFDLMVTEYAPIDLLLQRAGRLHRHSARDAVRPEPLKSPALWLVNPDHAVAGVPSFPSFENLVYARYILLRTAHTLDGRREVSLPDEIELLVESVYGEEPASLSSAWRDAMSESKRQATRSERRSRKNARKVQITTPDDEELLCIFNQQLVEVNPDTHKSLRASTREIDETVTVVLVYESPVGLSLKPNGSDAFDLKSPLQTDLIQRLIERSVSLRQWQWVRHFASTEHLPERWRTNGALRHVRLCALDGDWKYRCEVGSLVYRPDIGIHLHTIFPEDQR